jgi:hypothetical protein
MGDYQLTPPLNFELIKQAGVRTRIATTAH